MNTGELKMNTTNDQWIGIEAHAVRWSKSMIVRKFRKLLIMNHVLRTYLHLEIENN